MDGQWGGIFQHVLNSSEGENNVRTDEIDHTNNNGIGPQLIRIPSLLVFFFLLFVLIEPT